MGGFSLWHILIFAVILLLLFGGNRFSAMMGDVAKGLKSFKQGMGDDEEDARRKHDEQRRADDLHRAEDQRRADDLRRLGSTERPIDVSPNPLAPDPVAPPVAPPPLDGQPR